jgi:hypothetical protein
VPDAGSWYMVCKVVVILLSVVVMCLRNMCRESDRDAIELRGVGGTRSGCDHVGPHAVVRCSVLVMRCSACGPTWSERIASGRTGARRYPEWIAVER